MQADVLALPAEQLRWRHHFTPGEIAAIERAENASFALVRNGSDETGGAIACSRCGAGRPGTRAHTYRTLMCLERPYWGRHVRQYALVAVADEAERRVATTVPDLAASHPETARRLRPPRPGEDVYAVSLGLPEPITRARAQLLADAINVRAGRVLITLPPPAIARPERMHA